MCLAASGLAHADPTPAETKHDPAAAEALWREGRALRAAGKTHEACPKFAESYRLDPALGTLLNLAQCNEVDGKKATAWSEYRDAEDEARRAHDKKRETFAKQAKPTRSSRSSRRCPVWVDAPVDGLDGAPRRRRTVGVASLGTELPVDAGDHVIEASAPNRVSFRREIKILDGARVKVEIPKLGVAEKPGAPPPPVVAPEPGEACRALRPLPITAVAARRSRRRLDHGRRRHRGPRARRGLRRHHGQRAAADMHSNQCPNHACNATGLSDVSRAKTFAWASDVSFGISAAGLGTAIVLFAIDRSHANKPASRPHARPDLARRPRHVLVALPRAPARRPSSHAIVYLSRSLRTSLQR